MKHFRITGLLFTLCDTVPLYQCTCSKGFDVTLTSFGTFQVADAGLCPDYAWYYKWYQCFSGEILPHFYVKNIFLPQKLTKLQHFKENPSKYHYKISQNEKIQIINVK